MMKLFENLYWYPTTHDIKYEKNIVGGTSCLKIDLEVYFENLGFRINLSKYLRHTSRIHRLSVEIKWMNFESLCIFLRQAVFDFRSFDLFNIYTPCLEISLHNRVGKQLKGK